MTSSFAGGIYKEYDVMAKEQSLTIFQTDSYPSHSMRHSTTCRLPGARVVIITIKIY